jgi:serine/threonine-protein kinase
MGYVDGETLAERVRRGGTLPDSESVRVVREIAWALGHAHAVGIVHRDIKPANMLLERHTGRALVSDFGLAAPAGVAASGEARLGTPAYMSPEQATGDLVDGRSDLYALGATAFHAVTGRLPFEGSPEQMLAARFTRPAPTVATFRPDLPVALMQVIDRCLAAAPADRPASAEAVLELLAEVRPALTEAPLPVASYVRDAGRVFADVSAAAIGATSALGVYALAFRSDLFAAIAFYPIAALLYGLGLVRIGELVLRTRTLVGAGYTHDAIRPAIELEVRREQAEHTLQAAQPKRFTDRPAVMGALGAAKTAAFVWLATRGIDTLTLIGVSGAVLMPVATLRQMWRTSGKHTGLWGRLLKGRFGKWLFGIAKVGQRGRALPAADAPTEVFLGDAALRVFEALPAERRTLLAGLPDVVTRLQADALHATDGTRLNALAALENIRLDLLRLQAGEIEADQLTRDLDQARQIGTRIEQALDG